MTAGRYQLLTTIAERVAYRELPIPGVLWLRQIPQLNGTTPSRLADFDVNEKPRCISQQLGLAPKLRRSVPD